MKNDIMKLAALMGEASRIVFFGGAGVSTESGIPDFRSAQGLYRENRAIPPETILSRSFFEQHPDLFYAYYKEKLLAPGAKPNAAHLALAKLEAMGRLRCVITQNIDGLHQAAGSRNVLELHGSAARYSCIRCGKAETLRNVLASDPLPHCSACGGLVRPDIVLYEEGLDPTVTSEAVRQIRASDLLIIGGTSLMVYPAASYAQQASGSIVIINRDTTPLDASADLVIHAPIGETLRQAVDALPGA